MIANILAIIFLLKFRLYHIKKRIVSFQLNSFLLNDEQYRNDVILKVIFCDTQFQMPYRIQYQMFVIRYN